MPSKSPCSIPMISTTACDLASSRVNRWFSARNRPGSSAPRTLARCARRGAVAPRFTPSRANRPLPDLGLVQALTTQHRSLTAMRRSLILRDHPGPVGRGERATDRTGRRIYDSFSGAGHQIITGTGKRAAAPQAGELASHGQGAQLQAGLGRHHASTRPQAVGFHYLDGHVRVYTDTRQLPKTHIARMRIAGPATEETWVGDAAGDPVMVITAGFDVLTYYKGAWTQNF
jgi:hypothetical protein